uniref:DUF4460 domain-containing protein n=1 Tax=Timema poppense TaxID=170557 RepID=A0A7R9CQV7_TIMPO|nr:unnamed protein product [Timema poppensis]
MEKLCNLSLLELHRGAATSLALLCRYLSTAEVSTALRPFYFSVHPDLFGQYPAERTVNENSLKQLSSYLENLQQNRPSRPTRVTFYLRSQACTDTTLLKGAFRLVKISLAQHDVRKTVLSILQSCDLSTTYVDSIAPPLNNISRLNNERKFSKFDENHPFYSSEQMKAKIKRTKDAEQLRDWLSKNVSDARKKLLACQPVRDEIYRLEKKLCDSLGLHKVVWDCGWNITHFRGCLISFQSLATHHPDNMHVLKGRVYEEMKIQVYWSSINDDSRHRVFLCYLVVTRCLPLCWSGDSGVYFGTTAESKVVWRFFKTLWILAWITILAHSGSHWLA